jgi:hydrogenase-1 operon protein HyaF
MSGLQDISVRVENRLQHDSLTYNVVPVLHEIRHALQVLADAGDPTIIDLTAMPFGPGDEERLLTALGEGEVVATVNAIGETRVRETAYPGVWLVEHRAPDEARIALHVEVAEVPFLLRTPREDMVDGLRRLTARLAEGSTGTDAESDQ